MIVAFRIASKFQFIMLHPRVYVNDDAEDNENDNIKEDLDLEEETKQQQK